MNLDIHSPTTAPAGSQPVLAGIEADLGFVPNFAGAIATSPTLLAAFDGLRRAVGDATFDPVHREITGLAVGVAVDGRYGIAFHSTMLDVLGVPDEDVQAMRRGEEPSDPTHAAVYAFARRVVLDRGAVDPAVVERARAAGLGDAELLQVVAECALATLVGLVDTLAGRIPLDPLLQPRARA
jgi:alkylhydroperoxidase family enzyme